MKLIRFSITFIKTWQGDQNNINLNNLKQESFIEFTKELRDLATVNNLADIQFYFESKSAFTKGKTIFLKHSASKFHCLDYGQFYITREEVFPVNTKTSAVSSLTNQYIRGRIIRINDNFFSVSQALEFFKNTPLLIQNNQEILINPY